MSERAAGVTIVGLGPGDPSMLTLGAREAIAAAGEVWLRTARHPTVEALPVGPAYRSFDDEYDVGASFEDVYGAINRRLAELARRPEGLVYAVPGHPLFGEATTRPLLSVAADGVATRIVAGVSFLDAVAQALELDPLADGLLLLDALALGGRHRLLVPQRPTVIAQVYSARAASQAKLALLESYPPDHLVTIVAAAGDQPRRAVVPLAELDRDASRFDHLTSLYLPAVALPDDVRSFEGVRAIVGRLRDPDGGCPWDLEQTHETLKRFLLEEAYEALDALDEGNPARLAEELGDLLMQVLLHAQVAEDNGEFVIEDVLRSIGAKLVRRHPHVFGDVAVSGADDVVRNWETLKKEERGDAPVLDAVPAAMPALAQAQSVQSRAEKAGAPGEEANPDALLAAFRAAGDDGALAALGDLLFSIVAMARNRHVDAEEALRLSVRRFRREFAERS